MLFLVIVLIPVYVLFVTSFKGAGDASPARAWSLPQTWTTENWQTAWTALSPAIWRTVQMVVPSAIIAAFLGSLNGFVLSRWSFKGANIVFTLILFGLFIPYQAVIIPLNQLVLGLGIPSGVPSLILLHVIYGIPITTLIFRNYYMTVPHELRRGSARRRRRDAAHLLVDHPADLDPELRGRAHLAVHVRVERLPLRGVLLLQPERPRDARALNNLANGALLQNYGVSMAGALFASLPTLLVYIVLGKYFVGGLMSGSVKG